MRVGVDIRCLMDGRKTGVEEYTFHVLRAMVTSAPNDQFILFANSRKPMQLPRFVAPNVELCAYHYPNTLFTVSLKLTRWPRLDDLMGGVDVFFVPSVRLAPLRAGCPLVVTVHDLSFVRYPEFFSRERRIWHRYMEPRLLIGRARTIIAVSETTATDLMTLYAVPRSRIAVVHSGIPTTAGTSSVDQGRHSVERCRRRYHLPERFLLFLGTLEPRKNLDSLLAAYARVRARGFPHALVLAGVRGWLDERFFKRIAAHQVARDIVLTGFIDDADKPLVYQLADLFVYPSFYEGFGFPPLEALVAGTPVVTSYNSAIPEIAGPWVTLVNPYDPEELARVIGERLRQPAVVPQAVRAEILERYSWFRSGRETLAVLRAAAENPKRRALEFHW